MSDDAQRDFVVGVKSIVTGPSSKSQKVSRIMTVLTGMEEVDLTGEQLGIVLFIAFDGTRGSPGHSHRMYSGRSWSGNPM